MAPRSRLAIAVWLCAASAWADEGATSLVLDWNAALGCPDRASMIRSIAGLAGQIEVSTPVVATVKVVRADGAWNATVRIRRNELESTRAVQGRTCTEVADAAAVMIALVLDPEGTGRESAAHASDSEVAGSAPRDTAEERASTAPAADRATEAPRAKGSEAATRVVDYGLGAHALVDIGALPEASYGGGATVFANGAHLRLEVGGYVLANQAGVVPNRPESSGSIGLWSATATSCATTSPASWTAGWCVEVELGRMSAEASGGGVSPHEAHVLWGAFGTGPTVARRIAPNLDLVARADVLFPFARSTFYVDEAGDVFRPSSVAWRFRAGPEIHFR